MRERGNHKRNRAGLVREEIQEGGDLRNQKRVVSGRESSAPSILQQEKANKIEKCKGHI